jgi:hypothetical protein
MKKLNALYTLLIASTLLFQVACDDSGEVTSETGGETMAGMTNGGTQAGDTPEAGMTGGDAPMAGMTGGDTPMAGMTGGDTPEAGTPAEERVGPGDTAALSCSGDYCPSARLSGLVLPEDAAAATAGGCRLASERNGANLGALKMFDANLDTNTFVQPDENGEIAIVLLNHLVGWSAEATGNAAGSLRSNFYTGIQSTDTDFEIDPVSLDDAGEPVIFFDDTTVTDGLYHTPPSTFAVELPIAGLPIRLELSQTELTGFVTLDDKGFNMTEGALGGYLTRDAIVELVNGLGAACMSDTPPSLCDTIGFALASPESALQVLLPLLGYFDSTVAPDGSVSACADGMTNPDCNAISICILVEMSSVNVTGVGAAE